MIHSSRRDRKAKAIAEVLAMIADAQAPLAPHRPRPVLETDERLFETAAEFSAADKIPRHDRPVDGCPGDQPVQHRSPHSLLLSPGLPMYKVKVRGLNAS